jgi:hypothetical protein
MLPSGKCLRCIAPAAAMVDDLKRKKKTNKTQLLARILTVAGQKKAIESQGLPGALYSRPRRN